MEEKPVSIVYNKKWIPTAVTIAGTRMWADSPEQQYYIPSCSVGI